LSKSGSASIQASNSPQNGRKKCGSYQRTYNIWFLKPS
jgi:hypothetical protein